jgi:hypothetical protein
MNDADPGYFVPASTQCTSCGHPWSSHASRAHAERAAAIGVPPLACIGYHKGGEPYDLCRCPVLRQDMAYR